MCNSAVHIIFLYLWKCLICFHLIWLQCWRVPGIEADTSVSRHWKVFHKCSLLHISWCNHNSWGPCLCMFHTECHTFEVHCNPYGGKFNRLSAEICLDTFQNLLVFCTSRETWWKVLWWGNTSVAIRPNWARLVVRAEFTHKRKALSKTFRLFRARVSPILWALVDKCQSFRTWDLPWLTVSCCFVRAFRSLWHNKLAWNVDHLAVWISQASLRPIWAYSKKYKINNELIPLIPTFLCQDIWHKIVLLRSLSARTLWSSCWHIAQTHSTDSHQGKLSKRIFLEQQKWSFAGWSIVFCVYSVARDHAQSCTWTSYPQWLEGILLACTVQYWHRKSLFLDNPNRIYSLVVLDACQSREYVPFFIFSTSMQPTWSAEATNSYVLWN